MSSSCRQKEYRMEPEGKSSKLLKLLYKLFNFLNNLLCPVEVVMDGAQHPPITR
jgi:hypothetical protein